MIQQLNAIFRRLPAWPIYVAAVAWFAWLFWLGATFQTGPEPIRALEHSLGDIAIQTFIAVLAITPLRRYAGLNLLKFRRALGLSVFFFVAMHLGVWLFLDVQIAGQIWADIIKRPYITIGMAGFGALVPLALSSNDWSVRRMGAASWRKLHRLTYAAAILAAIHNVMVQKVWELESLVYLGLIAGLLALRLPRRRPVGQRSRA